MRAWAHGRVRCTGRASSWRSQGAVLGALLLCAHASMRPCAAQTPRYVAAQFACTIFDVRVNTTVTTEMEGRRRVEELRRDGRLLVQGTPDDSGIVIEAWWDSLALSRRADGSTLVPDASGLLGGRYRGVLTPAGRFTRVAAPWVPDEVAEVSDLSLALDDLFPNFAVGTMRPLTDSAHVHRYRLTSSKETDAPATTERPFAVHESESSDGMAVWGREGLLSWIRQVTAETRVAETARRAFRSQLGQKIELRRVGSCAGR